MKISALLPAVFLLPFCLPAQNLVPNCDFSKYLSCPVDAGQFDKAENWYTPGGGTTDLCHTCGGGNAGVPNNMWGYEHPYSGTGYGHIICYYPFQRVNYREYMEVELACQLDSGKSYRVSFWISCSDNSRYAIDGIGLLLTENALVQEGGTVIDPGMPLTVSQDPGVPIYMKNGWEEITGIITATGNERYITIGNFVPDNELTITEFSGLQTLYTSFYVDMVSVVPLSPIFELGPDTALCYGEPLLIDATMPCNAVYTWEDGSAYPLRNITQPGNYSIEIHLGCSVISDEIKVSWNPEPVLALPPDTVICPKSSVILSAGNGYDSYLWQDGSVQSSFLTDQPGVYWVEVLYGTGCQFRDTVNIDQLEPPSVDLGDDKILCFGDSIVLDAGNDNIYSRYLWNDNSKGRFLVVRQDGNYRVDVSNLCASTSDDIEITFRNCAPLLTIPNAFTPNQDGLNDFFLASGVNISYFRMQVFNRWGELLFESHDMAEGWDGRKKGINCPSDVYVWLVYYESEALDTPVAESLKGTVMLVR